MNNSLETILKHPIATVIVSGVIISGIADGVARILGVAKGQDVKPMVNVQIGSMKPEEE